MIAGKPLVTLEKPQQKYERKLDNRPIPFPSYVDGISRERFLRYGVPLYQAAMDGDWETADSIFKEDSFWVTAPITKRNDTALHIATAANQLDFVTKLVDLMIREGDRLELCTTNGNTAFCFAASSGDVDIAKVMVKKNGGLPNIKGSMDLTPLHMSILLGHIKMVSYLVGITHDSLLNDDDRIELVTSAIEADLYDVALHYIKLHPNLACHRNSRGRTVLHTLSQKSVPNQAIKESMWKRFMRLCTNKGKDEGEKSNLELALELTQRAWDEVIKYDETAISNLIGYPSRLLFDAAKMGNVDFLVTLILSYPDVIWKVDEKKRTIFHIAVEYRQEEIFKLIYEIGAIKDLLASYMDDDRNNMLHLAAKIAPPDRLNCVSGAALQMQQELLWFEAVEAVVQPHYAIAKNIVNETDKKYSADGDESFEAALNDDENRSESYKSLQNEDEFVIDIDVDESGMTPRALFTEQHEKLRTQGEEWMKKTAESCTLVATLITTVVFTAAFTLPGGNEDNGSPILLKDPSFKVFAIFNAVSLFASATSILMFLSILTSRYAEKDFLKVLPFKLMIGLTSLFVSIATMMVAFTATFFITFQRDTIWIPIPIALLAGIPVLLFGFQQYPLLSDIYRSTYRSRTLKQPSEQRKLCWKSKRAKTKMS